MNGIHMLFTKHTIAVLLFQKGFHHFQFPSGYVLYPVYDQNRNCRKLTTSINVRVNSNIPCKADFNLWLFVCYIMHVELLVFQSWL